MCSFFAILITIFEILFLSYINNKVTFGSAPSCRVVYTPTVFIATHHYNTEWRNSVGSASDAGCWNRLILLLMYQLHVDARV